MRSIESRSAFSPDEHVSTDPKELRDTRKDLLEPLLSDALLRRLLFEHKAEVLALLNKYKNRVNDERVNEICAFYEGMVARFPREFRDWPKDEQTDWLLENSDRLNAELEPLGLKRLEETGLLKAA